ncbi:hypothetical protein TNCV_3513301 [Trichonephila clavipes]|nr:hypothetical protein TNCV_3513301 [Trichonephila clavipes]
MPSGFFITLCHVVWQLASRIEAEYSTPSKETSEAESFLFGRSWDYYLAVLLVTSRVVDMEAGDRCQNCAGYFSVGYIKERSKVDFPWNLSVHISLP